MIDLFNIMKHKQNENKKIILIFEITGIFVLINIIGIYQIDAKEFTNQEYNIKFEYPDEWEQDVDGVTEYRVDYDKNFIVCFIAKDVDPAFLGKVTLKTYTNIPDIEYFEKVVRTELLEIEPSKRSSFAKMHMKNDIIDIEKHNLPENGQPYVYIETTRYAAKNSAIHHCMEAKCQ